MNETQATGVMVALFGLRCLLPIVLTAGIAYLMNRQVARWEAEASRPRAGPVRAQKPCWEVRNCDPQRRAACPAYLRSDRPCWQVRMAVEGRLPAGCAGCPLAVRIPVRV